MLKAFLLVDTAGALVGHEDDLATAQALADDSALATGRTVTLFARGATHVPRAFTEVERKEETPDGKNVVEQKTAKATESAKRAGLAVIAALTPEGAAVVEPVPEPVEAPKSKAKK